MEPIRLSRKATMLRNRLKELGYKPRRPLDNLLELAKALRLRRFQRHDPIALPQVIAGRDVERTFQPDHLVHPRHGVARRTDGFEMAKGLAHPVNGAAPLRQGLDRFLAS